MAITRLQLRTAVRLRLGEPEGTEKTWTNAQINQYIYDALTECAAFSLLPGYREVTVDEAGDTVAVPEGMLCVTKVKVGEKEYRIIPAVDELYMKNAETDIVVGEEEVWSVRFIDAPLEAGTVVTFFGYLDSSGFEASASVDNTAMPIGDRYFPMMKLFVIKECTADTEDDSTMAEQRYNNELKRLNLNFKMTGKFLYHRLVKTYSERCPY